MKSLPRGRHGLSREFVAQNQLERLLDSIAESLHRQGYEKTTVSAITAQARVSKSDFYRHFATKDACFLAAYDDSVVRLRQEVLSACEAEGDWAENVMAALAATLAYLSCDPARADLLLVEGLRAGPEVSARFREAVQSFVPYFGAGAPQPQAGGRSADGIDEAVVGGIASLLGRRLLSGEAEQLESFFPDLAEFALTPYLGTSKARRIISAR
jgi:AcrR family transcriptional regulator